MSLMRKLIEHQPDHPNALRDSIADNISALMSSHAPIWLNQVTDFDDYWLQPPQLLVHTLANFGTQHMVRSHSKVNTQMIQDEVESLIHLFEPRLDQVNVEVVNDKFTNQLHFRIDANLYTAKGVESVVFDSLFDFSQHRWTVRRAQYG